MSLEEKTYYICSKCKTTTDKLSDKFCLKCGKPDLLKECPECKEQFLHDKFEYCTNCGQDLIIRHKGTVR